MPILDQTSLARTVDAVNEAFFFGRTIPRPERLEVAQWIASRQGLPGSYHTLFAPTEADSERYARVFTGHELRNRGSRALTLGLEACRAVILLQPETRDVRQALSRAQLWVTDGLMARRKGISGGYHCCGQCSIALWRHLTVADLPDGEAWLAAALDTFRARRDGQGGWLRLPFSYAVLALSEMSLPGTEDELRYAAPALEALFGREEAADVYEARMRELARRVLGRL